MRKLLHSLSEYFSFEYYISNNILTLEKGKYTLKIIKFWNRTIDQYYYTSYIKWFNFIQIKYNANKKQEAKEYYKLFKTEHLISK